MRQPTCTQEDQHYKKVNSLGARRNYFWKDVAWTWVQQNEPEIAKKIRVEGYRRFPVPESEVDGRKSPHTDTFVDSLSRKRRPQKTATIGVVE
jgi:hypothetical protein